MDTFTVEQIALVLTSVCRVSDVSSAIALEHGECNINKMIIRAYGGNCYNTGDRYECGKPNSEIATLAFRWGYDNTKDFVRDLQLRCQKLGALNASSTGFKYPSADTVKFWYNIFTQSIIAEQIPVEKLAE